MKHTLVRMLAVMVLALVGFAANPAGATPPGGPYYATPSWDQTLPASTRFIVLSNMSNAAVLDRETGLVWEQSLSTLSFTWEQAHGHCNGLSTGGRLGWRLPSLQELASLVDPTVAPPGLRLPAGHPFQNVRWTHYWSATESAADAGNAWFVIFRTAEGEGFVDHHPKSIDDGVWCVRGGLAMDPQ